MEVQELGVVNFCLFKSIFSLSYVFIFAQTRQIGVDNLSLSVYSSLLKRRVKNMFLFSQCDFKDASAVQYLYLKAGILGTWYWEKFKITGTILICKLVFANASNTIFVVQYNS